MEGRRTGRLARNALEAYSGQDFTALVLQQPNFFGNLEEVDELTDWAHANNVLVIAVVNPTSLALLKPPGEWGGRLDGKPGADIVCGEGQPLGVPLASGGPYFGFMATRMQHVRQMPGRIVGRTADLEGRPGFSLTLQAREQHIRRSKATSNICTNQGLMVTAATIYMSLLGAEGLKRVAAASAQRTADLVAALTRIAGVTAAFDTPRFHEAVLLLDRPVGAVLAALAQSPWQARIVHAEVDRIQGRPVGTVTFSVRYLGRDAQRTLCELLQQQSAEVEVLGYVPG